MMLEMLALSHRTGIMPDRSVSRYLRSAMATDGLVKRFSPGLDVAVELEAGCRRYLASLLLKDFFSFETVASWSALMEAFLAQSAPGGDPVPFASSRAAPRNADLRSTKLTRTLRLTAVAFVFAALGTFTPGQLRLEADLLTAQLGISLVAILLAGVSLGRSG